MLAILKSIVHTCFNDEGNEAQVNGRDTMTRVSKTEWIAKKKAEQKELDSKLGSFLKAALETKDGMDELTAHYRISGLYNYSFFNSLLIMLQGGTIAQSYNKWKKLERCVDKGQKSRINVYAPIFKKEKLVDGTEEQKLVGFKLVPVFDVKQTSGKELEYDHNSTEELDIDYSKIADTLATLCKAEVVEENTGGARGYSDGKKLVVSSMSNDTDKAKTLIHEAAHHLVHTGDKKEEKVSRATGEVEAESIAYLVMSYLGMDFDLSKKYVANWKSGIKDARHGLIIKTADKMIKSLKKNLTDEELFIAKI
jgi:hypothetical protein